MSCMSSRRSKWGDKEKKKINLPRMNEWKAQKAEKHMIHRIKLTLTLPNPIRLPHKQHTHCQFPSIRTRSNFTNK